LPDAIAHGARDARLLTPQALARLINDALRRMQAADSLLSIADRVAAAAIPPMSMEEISAEVKAARAERKQRAGGHWHECAAVGAALARCAACAN
jgi:hypothetical protein